MTEREKFDLIDRYFKGELSEDEIEQFNAEWASDDQFAEEVANHQKVNEVIMDAGLIDVKRKLQSIHNKQVYANNNGRWVMGGIIGSSIGLIGLIIGGWLYFGNPAEIGKTLPSENTEVNTDKSVKEEPNKGVSEPAAPNDQQAFANQEEPSNDKYDKKEQQNNEKSANESSTHEKQEKSKQEAPNTEKNTLEMSKVENNPSVNNPIENDVKKDQPKVAKISAINNDTIDLRFQPTQKPKSKSPCDNTTISASYKLVKSCYDKNRGAIIIDSNSITGGEPPYQFSLSKGDNYKGEPRFNDLSQGSYTVYIKDSRSCKDALNNLYVAGKDCNKTNYTFAPEREESWEYPFDKQANGTLIIYKKNGEKVYQREIRNGTPSNWRGRDNNGKRLPMGLYLVTFERSGNITKTWNLSLVR